MDIEARLRQSIANVCAIPAERVRPEATLDDLGIDSLAAAEVFVELEIELGRELPIDLLRRLDEVTTVRGVAEALRAALEPSAEPLV